MAINKQYEIISTILSEQYKSGSLELPDASKSSWKDKRVFGRRQINTFIGKFKIIAKMSSSESSFKSNVKRIKKLASELDDSLKPKTKFNLIGFWARLIKELHRELSAITELCDMVIDKDKYIPGNAGEIVHKHSVRSYKALEKLSKVVTSEAIVKEDVVQEGLKDNAFIASLIPALLTTIFFFAIMTSSSFIMRLIAKKKGKVNEKLTKKVRDITKDDRVEVLYVNDDDVVNAFSDGTTTLYIYSGMVKRLGLTEGEVISILLHEYGHYQDKHTQKNISLIIGSLFLGAYLGTLVGKLNRVSGGDLLEMTRSGTGLGMIVAVLAKLPMGRKFERYADQMMVNFGYKKEAAEAFKKLDFYMRREICKKVSIQSGECSKMIKDLHMMDEHPETRERINTLLSSDVPQKSLKLATKDIKKLI